jgi:OFA family oxalate/formate antiporter-like MFS transporter
MRRWIILAASVVMQMCLGATYSWSVYVQPLKKITGLLQGPVQLPFTVFYFAFPATMIFAGMWLPRLGPRRCAVTGGILFGSGWLVAGFGGLHFGLTVVGIGLLAGIGVGLAYIVPIATSIRWFPDHKGLVTGVAVAGFGGGAALVSQAGAWLMDAHGATPFGTFRILGPVFILLVAGAGMCMQNPPGTRLGAAGALPWRRIVAHPGFKMLYVAMGSGLSAGFAVNANLKELFAGTDTAAGVSAVAAFAIANAAGRIIWGWCHDRLPGNTGLNANLILQAAVLLLSPWILVSPAGLLLFAVMTGFNYGGVLVLYASGVARTWGSEAVGQVYGLLFSANIPAALAPLLAGLLFDATHSFTPALWAIATLMVTAILLLRRSTRTAVNPDS